MQALRQGHALNLLLKAADLSRSTFYYHVKAQQKDRYAELKSRICAVYERHKGRYGYRRITAALRQAGDVVNHKTIQRLMQTLGLKSLVRPKKSRSYRGQQASIPNVLNRQFQAQRPNQKWVTDVTEFKVRGEKLYLSPVLDLYNGEIVSYTMQSRPHFSMVSNMLKKALSTLSSKDAPLLHSGSGLAIPHASLSARACPAPVDPKYVTQRQLSRQCRHGKLLRHTSIGILLPESLRQH